MDKRLIVIANSGLCNRLKPILSGARIAHATRRKLAVHWNNELLMQPEDTPLRLAWPGTWNDLFASPLELVNDINPFFVDVEWYDTHGVGATRLQERTNGEYQAMWDYNLVDRYDTRDVIMRSTWRFLRFSDEPALDFMSCLDDKIKLISEEMIQALPILEPAAHLREKIDRFAGEYHIGQDSLAIQVRRHHSYCRVIAPSRYCAEIERHIQIKQPNVIFLSSDDEAIELYLKTRFPIITYPKESYENVASLASGDAVVDLFLLSLAGTLVTACGSTFGELAWWLGGCRANHGFVYE